jgi:6-phosphofructokinase 2
MDGEEAEDLAGQPLPRETRPSSRRDWSGGVAKKVVIARGAEGNVLATAERRLFAAGPRKCGCSTVGAGDSFVAGLVLALSRGQSNAEALAMGSAPPPLPP